MSHHILKTDPAVFEAVRVGSKTFEIRFDDRGFKIGDALELRETVSTGAEMLAGSALAYTGRVLLRRVSHVLTGYGLTDGWCCLSFDASAALADARREGAEAMRDECEYLVRPYKPRELGGDHHAQHDIADAIRALPLPTAKDQS